MTTVLVPLHVFSRLFRPTRGVHASGFGWFRDLHTELANRHRARRFRRWLGQTSPPGHGTGEGRPLIPSPREPADDLPRTALSAAVAVVDPGNVAEPAALVRGHLVAHERKQAQQRAGRDRLSVAVVTQVAHATGRETAVEGAA